MLAFLAPAWRFLKSPAGKIIALVLVGALAAGFVYWKGRSDGASAVVSKVNERTLEETKERRQEGERIEREVENASDRQLIECLRTGTC